MIDVGTEILVMKTMHEEQNANGKGTAPMLVCYREGAKICLAQCRPFGDLEEKHKAFSELAMLIAASEADEVLFVSDSWMTVIGKDEAQYLADHEQHFTPPSDDDRRIEALHAFHMLKGAPNGVSYSCPYLRDYENKIYWVTNLPGISEKAEINGGFVFDLIESMFTATDCPYDTHSCGEILVEMGHSVALVVNGEIYRVLQ